MNEIIGREFEKAELTKILESSNAEFVAIYGRRRVGKTFLIKQFFENRFTFYLTGMANLNYKQQLYNFFTAYNQFALNPLEQPPKTWFEAFEKLKVLIKENTEEKLVIFLDELPWLDSPKSNFVAALEYFWNSYGSTLKPLKLIVCGSAASWMHRKIINQKGGLHNRVTKRIALKPFTLGETELFLRLKNIVWERYHIVQLYIAFGGIPFYLNEVEKGLSVNQVIDKICFAENGLLKTEYRLLYNSLFPKAEKHLAIIEALAKKNIGLNREEIVKNSKIANGGTLSKILVELELCGFIKKYQSFQKKSQSSLYKLTDPYTLFYKRFIENSKTSDGNTWINRMESATYKVWSGYAFENVCLYHTAQLKSKLGISGVYTEESSWAYQSEKGGAQIDLIIDRKDRIINLCEIKFSNDEFEITKDYAANLQNKINTFKKVTKTRKSVFLTFISTFGIKQNQYSLGLVQNSLILDDLF